MKTLTKISLLILGVLLLSALISSCASSYGVDRHSGAVKGSAKWL